MSKTNKTDGFPRDPRRWNNEDRGEAAENVLLDNTCQGCLKVEKCTFARNEWGSCKHHAPRWEITADMASAISKSLAAIRSAGGSPDWMQLGTEAFEAIERVMNEAKKK